MITGINPGINPGLADWVILGFSRGTPSITVKDIRGVTYLYFWNASLKKTMGIKAIENQSHDLTVYNYCADLYNNKATLTINKNKNINRISIIDDLIIFVNVIKDEYSKVTISHCLSTIKMLYTLMQLTYIDEINNNVIMDMFNNHKSNTITKTKNSYIVYLNMYIKYLIEHRGLKDIKLLVKFKESKTEKINNNNFVKFFASKQVDDILSFTNSYNDNIYRFIMFGFWCGLRFAEIMNIQWGDIDLVNKSITIQNKYNTKNNNTLAFRTKSGKPRVIPMKIQLYDYLNELHNDIKPHNTDYIIDNDYDNTSNHRDSASLRHCLECYKIKLVEYNKDYQLWTPHIMRHTFASLAVQSGVSIFKVSKWLGHSKVEITASIYAHLSPSDGDIDRF